MSNLNDLALISSVYNRVFFTPPSSLNTNTIQFEHEYFNYQKYPIYFGSTLKIAFFKGNNSLCSK